MPGLLEQLRLIECESVRRWFKPGMRVLEIGGGSGYQANIISGWGCVVTSVDVANRRESAVSYYRVQDYDGCHLPFGDGEFDVVFSSNVLEHVAHLPELLSETRRVLTSTGLGIHILPTSTWRFWTILSHYPFLAKYFASRIGLRLAIEDSHCDATLAKRGVFQRLSRALFAGPHGEYPNAVAELWYFSRKRWLQVFTRNGFSIVSDSPNRLFYTGYSVFPRLSMSARKTLSGILGSSCRVFVMQLQEHKTLGSILMTNMSTQHAEEIQNGNRFAFGENWSRFLTELNENRIYQAEQSLCGVLKVQNLKGKRFLDIGSGSGLFSLAARRLGATVHSFDYDPQSVACTKELRRRYFFNDPYWNVESGSVLDEKYISGLGCFDVVYSWGVLHHTGQMFNSLQNAILPVANDGQLFIAIYNDQGITSKYWSLVKSAYNKNMIARYFLVAVHTPYLFGVRWLVRALKGRLSLERGMSLWYDMIDWLGGYPFEVAKPEIVFHFFRDRGFALEELKTCGGRMGCNEFVFRRLQKVNGAA